MSCECGGACKVVKLSAHVGSGSAQQNGDGGGTEGETWTDRNKGGKGMEPRLRWDGDRTGTGRGREKAEYG